MNVNHPTDENFISKLTEIILLNLEKDTFGVNELASASGMTTFSLRRKLATISKKSINQLIREVRLQTALEMLLEENLTASEVAYKVGFGSPAYFTKCFHDYFGYPPGEAKSRNNGDIAEIKENFVNNSVDETEKPLQKKPVRKIVFYTAGIVLTIFTIYIFINNLSFENFSILPGKHLKSADKSIVVMTLQNINGDEENTHFAFGITENILTNLFKIKGIKVINTPVAYTDNHDSLIKIAGENGVRFILSGTVQQSGNSVIINPKLTDISEYEVIWSNSYNKKLNDIFQVTSNIAQQVALQLQTIITKREKKRIEKIPTTNQEAYSYYLMGRYLLNKRGWRDTDTSRFIAPFKKAIALEPNYAEAYTGLAEAYLNLTRSQNYPRPKGFLEAKENARKALELDNNLAEAHAILGAIYRYEWEWEKAREELEWAIELNPNYIKAHDYYAGLMKILRQDDLSRYHSLKAIELDPVAPYHILYKANILAEEGKIEDAQEEYQKYIELYPEIYSVYWHLWDFYFNLHEEQKAVESLQKAFQFDPKDGPFVDTIKSVYKRQGILALEQWLNEYNIMYDDTGSWRGIAIFYNNWGQKEKALDWLEKAYEWKIPELPNINGMKCLDNLRNEPRFQALLDSMRLAPYQ